MSTQAEPQVNGSHTGAGRFYVTTPIYYPSDQPHIGTAYTTVAADTLARWHRFKGEDVFFLTGTDEHGQKVERAAQARGETPAAYVKRIGDSFAALWQRLDIAYDDFIRTTQPRHVEVVQHVFAKLYEQGDIYKGTYVGRYCTPCETFWVESKLVDGNCPDCGRPVQLVEEESYFLRMSKYTDRLLAHIEAHPEFIQPAGRRLEMVNFIKSGLEDLAVSRTTFDWGVRVPFDPGHVVYVWIDALTNYLTGIGYRQDEAQFARFWPADLHLVGKDILRFHTIIWPILLMALDLPLPKQVFGHGWLLASGGDKMSKSKGNVVDPNTLLDAFGTDAIRYFLLREIAFGQDANFSVGALIERTNADLANDLGNSLHRSLAMLGRYFGGVVPPRGPAEDVDRDLERVAEAAIARVDQTLERLELNVALAELWLLVGRINKYIDETEPWKLARNGERERLAAVMYNTLEAIRIVAVLVKSFLPRTGEAIWAQLGIAQPLAELRFADLAWGGLAEGTITQPGQPIFPRIDPDHFEIGGPGASGSRAAAEGEKTAGKTSDKANTKEKTVSETPKSPETPDANEGDGLIDIDQFAKVKLRLAEVVAAERHPNADRLLKLQVDLGGERRQIVAGIAKHYTPEQLVGRRIVVVANLKPATLRGEKSEGMLLAASSGEKLSLLSVEGDLPPGSEVR
ncbi:MAG TPA: methionine--tRNA ligase [Limnochordia bacterium]|nr:methionine--tRNA ligase [Limnochordia bacterium]